jgi:hypothetical protein
MFSTAALARGPRSGGCKIFGGLPLAGYVARVDPITALIFVAIGFAVFGIMVLLRDH